VEKNQYELCIEVLKRLEKAGILKEIILIGSWCIPFYGGYFAGTKYPSAIRTRDMDFLIPDPHKIRTAIDIPELLKDLGFVIGYGGEEGYIRLEHPELIVEFLSPQKGKGTDKPIPLPALGVNAVALRFLGLLTDNIIKVRVEDFDVLMPHPVVFSFHKLIISQYRPKGEKAIKDRNAAVGILKALIEKGESELIKEIYSSLLPKWKKKVLKGLQQTDEHEVILFFNDL
jgi:hypothetical protein